MVSVTTVTPVVTGTSEQALSEHEVTVTTVVDSADSVAVEVETAPEVAAPEVAAPEVAAADDSEAADEAEAAEEADEAADEATDEASEAADEAAEEAEAVADDSEASEAAEEADEATDEADEEAADEIDEASSLMVFDKLYDKVALLINFLPSVVVISKSTSIEYGAELVA